MTDKKYKNFLYIFNSNILIGSTYFLAHLTWRVIWAIAITWRPSSVVNISIFSSEAIRPFGTKLGRNIPWVDLYKVFIFGGSNLKHGRQGQLCVVIGWNFKELLWNHLTNWTEIWWEWWGDRPLKFCGFFCRSEIQDGHRYRT